MHASSMWLSSCSCNWGAAADLSNKMFTEGTSWGFTDFMPLKDVLDKDKGFLKDDMLEVGGPQWQYLSSIAQRLQLAYRHCPQQYFNTAC